MRNVQEVGLTEIDQVKQAKSGQYRSSHRFPSSKLKQQDEHVREIATEKEVESHYAVAISPSPSLFKVDHDKGPHSHDVADELKKRRHRQLSCNNGSTMTGT